MGENSRKDSDGDEPEPEIKRPIDPKRVLQILECRRRTLKFVESMLEPNLTIDDLKVGEEFLCKADYDCIVHERSILKLCGYPPCSNALTREWKQQFHISWRNKQIYDVEVRKLYCSVKCMNNSIDYNNEHMPDQPIWMRAGESSSSANSETLPSNP